MSKVLKLFIIPIMIIFIPMMFAMVSRTIRGKDPFISINYIMDYVETYKGAETFEEAVSYLRTATQSLVDSAKRLPDLNGNLGENVLDVVKYIGDVMSAFGMLLVTIVFVIPYWIEFFLENVFFVLDFIPYILSY